MKLNSIPQTRWRQQTTFFFKEMARRVGKNHDVAISFLPKPIPDDAGSGMHVHQELQKNGKNLFFKNELTSFGKKFISGQLKHITGLTYILNPTENSYNRLLGGYEAPRYVCWGHSNRSALIRIPPSGRIEIRSPDFRLRTSISSPRSVSG